MGIQQLLVGGGGVVQSFSAWNVLADNTPGNSATATLTFNTDGTVSGAGTPNDGGTATGTTSWYRPTVSGIGSSYWIKFTATSGTLTTNDASSFTALSSARSVTKAGSTSSATCTFTVEIASDSGGTNIVFTSTENVVRYQHSL